MSSANDRESDEAQIVRAVLRLARAMRRSARAAELTGGALALIATLYRKGPLSAVALARAEGLQPQSLSRLLVRMEAGMLIERGIDPEDRRRHVITLTSRGRNALRSAMTQRREWLGSVMAERLNETERASLRAAAEIMLRIADPLEEDQAAD
ncbi:MarR family winged helix-turn-helix transcriptional regulator [Sphingomonas sp. DC1600-2]|uniref:MarR family winged helix-turn-helix transcriptional regulator n=1 Tax=unclassified Sphingomonas TaxID=196159 RepID=UPI003CF5D6A5